MEHNMIGWFEIPVRDMDRARKFYEEVFQVSIQVEQFSEILMGWFPWAEGKTGASGSLVLHEESYTPSDTAGVLVYFSSKDVADEIGRIEAAGGKVGQPKTQISEDIGYMGLFIDSEGNRIALHSRA